jgi:hypothetical protein
MLMLMDKSDESDDIQGARQLQPGKFWVIHLLVEADFNLMVGICFGRQAMYHAKEIPSSTQDKEQELTANVKAWRSQRYFISPSLGYLQVWPNFLDKTKPYSSWRLLSGAIGGSIVASFWIPTIMFHKNSRQGTN